MGAARPSASTEGEPLPGLSAVEFLDDTEIMFAEHPFPGLTSRERVEVDRIWRETQARNPAAFDGPIAAALGVDQPRTGPPVVRWAATTYRSRALRRLRPLDRVPGALFVTVLVPTERGLLIGRGSPCTAHPGFWALPGGAVEPPRAGQALDRAELGRQAARELVEETGVSVDAGELRPWALTRGRRFGSLGFHFLCPPQRSDRVLRLHAELAAAHSGSGTEPELDQLSFVPSPALAGSLAPTADFLPQLLDRYFTSSSTHLLTQTSGPPSATPHRSEKR